MLDEYTQHFVDELKSIDGFWYVASPYSDEDRFVVLQRALEAEKAVAWLTLQNVVVFGAIHHSHSLVKYGLDGDWITWQKVDEVFLDKCSGLIVLQLNGWTQSKGVENEIQYCIHHDKPIYYMRRKTEGKEVFNYIVTKKI